MVTNLYIRPVGTVAATIGIIQGLVWFILSFIAILIHLEAWVPEFPSFQTATHGERLSETLVAYLTEANIENTDFVLGSTALFMWSIIYLITSICWVGLSSSLLWALRQEKHAATKKICLGWAIWTGIICALDFILAILLAVDYDTAVTLANQVHDAVSYQALALGVLMTLAAKGFILWIVNLVFAILIGQLSSKLTNKAQNNAYNNNTMNSYPGVSNTHQGNTNPAFWDDSNSFVAPSAQPFKPPQTNYPIPPPKPNPNDRLAKIGRPGAPGGPSGRSSPYNVAPPKPPQNYIYPSQPGLPEPDYSPPNSPLKSALKSRPPPQNPFTFPGNNRY